LHVALPHWLDKISIHTFVYHDLGYWQEHTIGGNDFFMAKIGHLAIKRGPEKAPKDIFGKNPPNSPYLEVQSRNLSIHHI